MSTKREHKEEIDIKEQVKETHQIILYNDDVNTFDHVIDTLQKICDHTEMQAEQCAMLVHYKGKCVVKSGELSELIPLCSGLLDAGLSAEIE